MLSRTELADLLHVQPDTVIRLVTSGELVGYRVGGQWRFDPEDVASFLERSRSTGFTSPEAVA
jgi:excisionase family DNA binding protein